MSREIVVNGRFLSRLVTGVERHGREIVRWMGDRCRVEKTRVNSAAGHAWEQFILPRTLNSNSVLWSPANTGPLWVQNQALTIHDLSPLEHPEWFRASFSLWYRLFLPVLAKRVRVVFTPSEHVKRKITKRFGITNVIVAPNGVDTSVFHPEARQRIQGLPKKYILFVGSLQPRKNLGLLLNAWDELKGEFADTWLLIAGSPGSVFGKVKFRLGERTHRLGYIPEDALPGLYAHSECLVLPSLDEGFGLPALEAMACGTAVLVSDGGALPEVVGHAARVFPLSEPRELKRWLKECLSNPDLRWSLKEAGLMRARQFSWQTTADLVWKTLHEL
ncbi:MAG: glycosyltransferase family 4 protein [Anaerolineales bacterium]|nr:glycosyltransferase family 4 protein [Anaerolineales bacterium]